MFLVDYTTMRDEADAILRDIYQAYPETEVIACIPESRADGGEPRASVGSRALLQNLLPLIK